MQAIGFTGPMGFYMQDYGGPIGNRLIERSTQTGSSWQVIQNANTYEEGFTAAWDGIRHVLWANRNAETEAPLEAFLGAGRGQGGSTPPGTPIGPRSARTTGTWTCSFWAARRHTACNSTCSTTTAPTPRSTRPGQEA